MRPTRIIALSILVVLVAAVGGRIMQHAIAEEELAEISVKQALPNRPVTLRDRLIVGLQARLKSEVAFIDEVVAKVDSGQLPQRQVDQTFFWARQHAALARVGRWHRPIIYFQPAMRARANRLHISL